jgi:hypothetical protein
MLSPLRRGEEPPALSWLRLPRDYHERRQGVLLRVRHRTAASIPATPARRRADRSRSARGSCARAFPGRDGSATLLQASDSLPRAGDHENADRRHEKLIMALSRYHERWSGNADALDAAGFTRTSVLVARNHSSIHSRRNRSSRRPPTDVIAPPALAPRRGLQVGTSEPGPSLLTKWRMSGRHRDRDGSDLRSSIQARNH